MPTNQPVLRTTEQFMNDYKPIYQPIYGLFLPRSTSYAKQVGKVDFSRLEAIGDLRNKNITPKDTEIHQIGAREGSKTFKKYFFGSQFQQSGLQDPRGKEAVVAQILEEHQKQFDELLSMGDGTSDGSVVNNGLFWSGDPNHVTNGSEEVQKDGDSNYLADLHRLVVGVANDQADVMPGRKVIMFYGSNIVPLFDALYPASQTPFKSALQGVLGANYSLAKLQSNVVAANSHGFLVVNLDFIDMHYCALPALESAGTNDEKKYIWHNFLSGSVMLDCLASGAIVKQALTLEA